jgi:hypothetical protein
MNSSKTRTSAIRDLSAPCAALTSVARLDTGIHDEGEIALDRLQLGHRHRATAGGHVLARGISAGNT